MTQLIITVYGKHPRYWTSGVVVPNCTDEAAVDKAVRDETSRYAKFAKDYGITLQQADEMNRNEFESFADSHESASPNPVG